MSPIGLGFLLPYGHAKDDAAGNRVVRRTFSLGYDYFLSKATDIYAVVMNERTTALSSANTVAAGVRLASEQPARRVPGADARPVSSDRRLSQARPRHARRRHARRAR